MNVSVDEVLDCGLPIGQCDILRLMKKVTLSVDIFILVVTAFCIITLRKYKFFNERIFCYMHLNNFLSAVTGFSHDAPLSSESTGFCISQGYFMQVTSMCKFTWVAALTVYLYFRLVKDRDTIHFEWLYIVACCGVPILLALIPVITNDYGYSETPYCWIKGSSSGNILRIVIYWIPVFGGLFIVMLAFIYMYWHAHKAIQLYGTQYPLTLNHRMLVRKYLKPLVAYAVSLAVLNLPQFINRIDDIISGRMFGLTVAHVLCNYSYGIVLSTLFFVTNGRKSFTLDKFTEGFYFYRRKLTRCRNGNGGLSLCCFHRKKGPADDIQHHV